MSKKMEQEIIMKEKFKIPSPFGGAFDAELRLKRRGTKFIVEKSCFTGEHTLHVNSYDDVTPAYEEYESVIHQYQDNLR